MQRVVFAAIVFCLGWVVAVSPARATPASAQDEVLAADQARADALIHQDYAALDKVMADDMIYCHASGHVDTKASYIAAMHAGTLQYFSMESKDMHARVNGNIAVLNGQSAVKVRNGSPDVHNLNLQVTAVYEKRDGRWQLISFQSTNLPAPAAVVPVK